MATEKQISYIKSLIHGLKFENVLYLNKNLDALGGVDEADHQRAIATYHHNCREWMLRSLYADFNPFSEKFDGTNYESAIPAYKIRIAELDQMDYSKLDNPQISKVINNLKRLYIGA